MIFFFHKLVVIYSLFYDFCETIFMTEQYELFSITLVCLINVQRVRKREVDEGTTVCN